MQQHDPGRAGSYGDINFDLVFWAPLTARRVLEVGPGEGALANAYRKRNPTAEYVATQRDAGAMVATRVDRLISADFTALSETEKSELGLFDLVILSDVLENLADPLALLRALKPMLSADGRMVLSAPNAAHWTNLARLMTGAWPAAEVGLPDRTGQRFFTLQSLTKLIEGTGLKIERLKAREFSGNPEAAEQCLAVLGSAAEQLGQDKAAFIKRASAFQYIASIHDAKQPPLKPLHLHMAALAPGMLDARTRLPVEAMHSDPRFRVTYREKSTTLPAIAENEPKLAILQRLVVRRDDHWRTYSAQAYERGWTFVYEIDDHPDLIGNLHGGDMSALIWGAVRDCHAVQTSTEALAAVLRRENPNVAVFPNMLLDIAPFSERPGVRRIFFGALNREAFSSRVAAALAPAIAAHPELEFVVLNDKAFFQALPTNKKSFAPASPYAGYLDAMARCDLVLSPLEGAEGERYKSDIKYLEAARCGALFIASPCVYEDTVRHGETGLIAAGLNDWSDGIIKMVGDPALRNRIARAAWDEVRTTRMMSRQIDQRYDWYASLIARRADLEADRAARNPPS